MELEDIYPNPARAITVIPVKTDWRIAAKVELLDVMGRVAGVLFDGDLLPGKTNVFLNAQDYASGTYFVRVKTEREMLTRKLAIQ